MKRIVSAILVAALSFAMVATFCACSSSKEDTQTTTEYHIEQDDNFVDDPF